VRTTEPLSASQTTILQDWVEESMPATRVTPAKLLQSTVSARAQQRVLVPDSECDVSYEFAEFGAVLSPGAGKVEVISTAAAGSASPLMEGSVAVSTTTG